EVSGPRVTNSVIALAVVVEDSLDARGGRQQFPHLVAPPLIVDVDVRDLVIDDRKRRARARVEDLESQLLPDGNHSRVSQHAVDVDGRRDLHDAVLREHDGPYAPAFVELDQLANHGVYRTQIIRH